MRLITPTMPSINSIGRRLFFLNLTHTSALSLSLLLIFGLIMKRKRRQKSNQNQEREKENKRVKFPLFSFDKEARKWQPLDPHLD